MEDTSFTGTKPIEVGGYSIRIVYRMDIAGAWKDDHYIPKSQFDETVLEAIRRWQKSHL